MFLLVVMLETFPAIATVFQFIFSDNGIILLSGAVTIPQSRSVLAVLNSSLL